MLLRLLCLRARKHKASSENGGRLMTNRAIDLSRFLFDKQSSIIKQTVKDRISLILGGTRAPRLVL